MPSCLCLCLPATNQQPYSTHIAMAGIVVEWTDSSNMVTIDETLYNQAVQVMPITFEQLMANMPMVTNWADEVEAEEEEADEDNKESN